MDAANYVCPVCGNPNYMRWLPQGMSTIYDLKCINCNTYFKHNQFDLTTRYVGKHEHKGDYNAKARI